MTKVCISYGIRSFSAFLGLLLVWVLTASAQTSLPREGIRFPDGSIQEYAIDTGETVGTMLYWNGFRWLHLPFGEEGQRLEVACDGLPVWADTFACGCEVTDIDGNVYSTVRIGKQCWMRENLKATRYQNGDTIPNITDNPTWDGLWYGAWCNYDNLAVNDAIYGKLYNFYAASDSRNICPSGWHVPTLFELLDVYYFLTDNGYGYEGGGIAKAMADTSRWANDPVPGNVGNDQPSNNTSGFSALPGGTRQWGGFMELDSAAYFITKTEAYPTDAGAGAWQFGTLYNSSGVSFYPLEKRFGAYCRCVKD